MEFILENFRNLFSRFTDTKFAVIAAIIIALLGAVYYFVFKFLRKNNANLIIYIFLGFLAIFAIFTIFSDNDVMQWIFIGITPVFFLAVGLIYSVEIKRFIWSFANRNIGDVKHHDNRYNEEEVENCINEIIKALQNMSKNDIGAIIILSNGNVPKQILESGVKLDCNISAALIESVFFPKTPLHDGAMIINGTRIVAAGCFLPLSQMENLPKELGTRHRAGIGITETIDVTSLIVSEETGIISTVKAGKITRYADANVLKNTLSKFYWQEMSLKKE